MLSLLQSEISLKHLFTLGDPDRQKNKKYRFRGMICYYGKHYNAYFFSETSRQWVVFDDTTVKYVGSWSDVLQKTKLGHFHPSVLFYELIPSNEPIIEKPNPPSPKVVSVQKPESPPSYIHPVKTKDSSVKVNGYTAVDVKVQPGRSDMKVPPNYFIVM